MNLLFHSPTFHPHVGGAESLVDDLAAVLVERGHDITVLTGSGEPSHAPEERRGARVVRFHYPGFLPFARLDVLRWHRRLLHEHAIEGVVVGRVDPSCWYLLALRRLLGFRLTAYLHGGELRALRFESGRFRRALRAALLTADTIVAVSEALRDEAVAFAPTVEEKIRVVPNGVDLAAIRAAAPVASPRPYVLFAARLERVKNAALAVEGFARAAARVPSLDLVVAGTGSEATKLAGLVAARGLGERVRFLGAVERERVYGLMRGALCLLVPSLAEGHPLVVLEAWAARLPVLASDVKGLRDVVHDGVDGVLFPSGDEARLADLIVRAATEPDAHAALRARIAALDLRPWDIRTLAERHLEALAPAQPARAATSERGRA